MRSPSIFRRSGTTGIRWRLCYRAKTYHDFWRKKAACASLNAPTKETLWKHIEQADIVHLEWWNHAAVYDFLRTSWPPMRLLVFCHVAGDVSPNLITSKLVDFADFWVSGCGYAQRHAVIQGLPPNIQSEKTAVVHGHS